MASSIVLSFRPPGIRPCAAVPGSGGGARVQRSSGSWWAPIFGWNAEPDYIESGAGAGAGAGVEEQAAVEERPAVPRRRFAALTEEKARELRMRTMETENFHDVMYHSAIASRLASDHPRRHSSSF